MNDDELARKLAEISRALFINRCLMIFIAVCLGILLFLPRLAGFIAKAIDDALNTHLAGVLISFVMVAGILFAVTIYIVSRIAPKPSDAQSLPKRPRG